MRHLVLTGTVAALAFAGAAGAQAQVYVEPYAAGPAYVAPPPPVVAAPGYRYAPGYGYGYTTVVPPPGYVAPGYYGYAYAPQPAVPVIADEYTTIDPVTGRRCTRHADGYRWCWTP
jgi:hypothetical protein